MVEIMFACCKLFCFNVVQHLLSLWLTLRKSQKLTHERVNKSAPNERNNELCKGTKAYNNSTTVPPGHNELQSALKHRYTAWS